MKRTILIFAVVFGVFESYGQDSTTVGSYTLEQCIAYGLENQNMITIAKLDYDESKAKVGETGCRVVSKKPQKKQQQNTQKKTAAIYLEHRADLGLRTGKMGTTSDCEAPISKLIDRLATIGTHTPCQPKKGRTPRLATFGGTAQHRKIR